MKKIDRLGARLLHNWGLKLASVFLAFVIWFVVAQVGDPKDTRAYQNIKVKLVNVNLLDDQNKYYEVLEQTDTVKVNVTAPTSVFQTLRASDIIAEADVSKLTDINTIAITYYAVNTSAESISFEGDHDFVKLDVENRISKWIRVSYQAVGNVAEGYVIGSTTSDQTSIYVSGPESAVSQVSSAYAEINVEGATNNSSANVDIYLRNRDNEILNLDNVELNTNHVLLSVEVLATKEVPVDCTVTGTPADGYMQVGEATQDVDSVLLAGSIANLARITRITIPSDKLDITGATEDKTFYLNVRDYLPDNVKLADTEYNGRLTVEVSIKASKDRTIEVSPQNVSIINVPEGYTITIPKEQENQLPVAVKIFGLRETINAIRAASVTGTADISAWMQKDNITNLHTGFYDVPVQVDLGEEVTILDIGRIRLEVTKQEAEE